MRLVLPVLLSIEPSNVIFHNQLLSRHQSSFQLDYDISAGEHGKISSVVINNIYGIRRYLN